jgi:hypothetical protein
VTALQATHGSGSDCFVNGNVVTQYFNSASLGATRDKAESSAFKSPFKSYVAGMSDVAVEFGGMYDPVIDGMVYQQLTNITSGVNTNLWLWVPEGAGSTVAGNTQGAAAFGNPGWSVTGQTVKYTPKGGINEANTITASVQLSQDGGGIDRGVIYVPWQSNAAGSSSSINYGSTNSTNGGALVVHCFSDVASLVVNLQDSADNATWANVTGYTLSPTNATIGGYRYPAYGVTPSQTIRQYTRVTWTGSGTFVAFFSRH